ncbi:HAMP domain-containing sensor histidine kinase [Martelella sp. HB161492]|uniref:sensor histidine kinase n=1 Tax=Martelella sp. HB161492 TaxID=2720726 RepID=UPI001FEEAAE8|nr:HAMP domain-containing sensor histidine kinase [Martelella sp. HB161492]
MLDLKTLLLFGSVAAALQAAAWLLIWRVWQQFYELRDLAIGFVSIAIGLALFLLRDPEPSRVQIFFDNMFIKVGVVAFADGMSRFLGQPGFRRLAAWCLVIHMTLWLLALVYYPGDLALRLHLSAAFTLVIFGMMIHSLWIDQTLPAALKWTGIVLLAGHIGIDLLQSALVYWWPVTVDAGPVISNVNAWYFFESIIFMSAFYICLLFMLGIRLNQDLLDRNRTLSMEIATRRRLQAELSTSLAAERASREEQQQLVHTVSHEFRTPLAAIRYAGEMLEMLIEQPSETIRKRLQGIDESVTRMTMLIDKFLDSERLIGGAPETETIDFSTLAENVRNHFDRVEQASRLRFTVADDLPEYHADVEMLWTIIVNLVDNALKYSPFDRPVELGFLARNDLLIIEVRDRGIGVPRAETAEVGRRFFRASNTGTIPGTGLGLNTCCRLAGYHGGTVLLYRRFGGGTTAVVQLPLPGMSPAREGMGEEPLPT